MMAALQSSLLSSEGQMEPTELNYTPVNHCTDNWKGSFGELQWYKGCVVQARQAPSFLIHAADRGSAVADNKAVFLWGRQ